MNKGLSEVSKLLEGVQNVNDSYS